MGESSEGAIDEVTFVEPLTDLSELGVLAGPADLPYLTSGGAIRL